MVTGPVDRGPCMPVTLATLQAQSCLGQCGMPEHSEEDAWEQTDGVTVSAGVVEVVALVTVPKGRAPAWEQCWLF